MCIIQYNIQKPPPRLVLAKKRPGPSYNYDIVFTFADVGARTLALLLYRRPVISCNHSHMHKAPLQGYRSVLCAHTGSDEKSSFLRQSPLNIKSECAWLNMN